MTKALLSWILSYRVGQLRYLASKTYVEGVSQLRRSASIVFGLVFFVALFMSGIILMAVGFAMIVPLSAAGRGMVVFSIGGIALAGSVAGYLVLNSERMWIRLLRVDSVLKAIRGPMETPGP
jgi:hypothetical protein